MTATKAILVIVAIVVVAQLLILVGVVSLGGAAISTQAIFLHALLLALVIAPPIYWLVIKPVRREFEKRVEAERVAQDMTRLAITDPLTRLMNRRGITVSLIDAMAQAERYDHPLSIAMADIDHFKSVNDSHGHDAGDKVLVDVAALLSEALRMPDKVGRYGGEEFLVVLPHTALAQAKKIAERMRAAVEGWTFEHGVNKNHVTISIGLTQYRKGEDLEQLLSRVDQALYQAKSAGRNKVITQKPA
ncbi:MAG: GGDEF domain-containing protein [Gammaproteobacteria bacterium]